MTLRIEVRGRTFAANFERCGVYELRGGAYMQHRGDSQAGPFRDEAAFRRYVQRMLRAGDPEARS